MNEAIKRTSEIIEVMNDVKDPSECQIKNDALKPSINNLLHMYLPEQTTVKECEILGMVIYDIINNPSRYMKGEYV